MLVLCLFLKLLYTHYLATCGYVQAGAAAADAERALAAAQPCAVTADRGSARWCSCRQQPCRDRTGFVLCEEVAQHVGC
jgi:hypothetical protein